MTSTAPQPGAAVAELVAVMDRLRSPGGCPWDAEQTPESLVPYLLEEAHEAAEAIESGDRDHIVEELGDVLLQVVFQARVGQEHPEVPFDLDDIAAGLTAKLRRRHPHVFADVQADTPEQVAANWEQLKAAEKEAKGAADGPLHGIPAGMPSLARAAKVVSRLDRAGLGDRVDAQVNAGGPGAELLGIVARLVRDGDDPDAALRAAVRALADAEG